MLPQVAFQPQRFPPPFQHLTDRTIHNATQDFLPSNHYRPPRSTGNRPIAGSAQYAIPIHHHPSSPSREGNERPRSSNDPAYTSEHMLRRKTPSGTLAAGYDGTPVRWSTKPPASKHLILPMNGMSNSTAQAVAGEDETHLIMAETASRLRNTQLSGPFEGMYENHRPSEPLRYPSGAMQNTTSTWTNRVPNHEYEHTPSGTWSRLPPLGPAAVYDQSPMHQPTAQFMYNGMQIPTVLQPVYQPCPPPTASNGGGMYGPYWPDGKFSGVVVPGFIFVFTLLHPS
jgi:hypothetical protein